MADHELDCLGSCSGGEDLSFSVGLVPLCHSLWGEDSCDIVAGVLKW